MSATGFMFVGKNCSRVMVDWELHSMKLRRGVTNEKSPAVCMDVVSTHSGIADMDLELGH